MKEADNNINFLETISNLFASATKLALNLKFMNLQVYPKNYNYSNHMFLLSITSDKPKDYLLHVDKRQL